MAVGQRIADSVDPTLERLVPVPVGNLEYGEPLCPVPVEHRPLMFHPLLEQHLGHLTERARHRLANSGLDLVFQREVVGAVEPRRDLRRGQQPFRHEPIVAEGYSIGSALPPDLLAYPSVTQVFLQADR